MERKYWGRAGKIIEHFLWPKKISAPDYTEVCFYPLDLYGYSPSL